MKVWIVIDFEGCFEQGEPVAAYDSEFMADLHAKNLESSTVIEMEVLSKIADAN
jgi:hypothetical protein